MDVCCTRQRAAWCSSPALPPSRQPRESRSSHRSSPAESVNAVVAHHGSTTASSSFLKIKPESGLICNIELHFLRGPLANHHRCCVLVCSLLPPQANLCRLQTGSCCCNQFTWPRALKWCGLLLHGFSSRCCAVACTLAYDSMSLHAAAALAQEDVLTRSYRAARVRSHLQSRKWRPRRFSHRQGVIYSVAISNP
jgi:hypothetical protein